MPKKSPSRHLRRASCLFAFYVSSCLSLSGRAADPLPPEFTFPAPTMENRLWTRWWWLGSAVDAPNLTRQLEAFHAAGLGGVEICPIYGAYTQEKRYLDFLSPEWVQMLAHTSRETQRLGMGLDLTTGTGWPFGKKETPDADASTSLSFKFIDHIPAQADIVLKNDPSDQVATGNHVSLVSLLAFRPDGTPVPVSWPESGVWKDSPPGDHFLAAFATNPIQKVKRSAPGAQGNVLDPYSVPAISHYLADFDKAFDVLKAAGVDLPRAEFHDSFEYYNATWTDDFFSEFQKRRGYDLHAQLPALAGQGPADLVSRVKCDYRETLSDLHLAYMARWKEWAHSHGEIVRNQAHGGPGNILDAYANADIPECEIFHLYEEGHLPMLKLSSSAAHLTGKRLASSESFTWLDEHFTATWSEVKPAADFLFLAGVNHLFLHGIPYSPADAPWPGWQFYASVNFGPTGGLWNNMPDFAAYVARCQSVLQANRPNNDALLYVPFHEFWSDPANNDKLMIQFTTPGLWMKPYAYYTVATTLWDKSCAYDEVSDKLLGAATVRGGNIILGDGIYRVLIIPHSSAMPLATVQKLVDLAKSGARIDFQDDFPQDVPGLGDLDHRRAQLQSIRAQLQFEPAPNSPSERQAKVGSGLIRVASLASLIKDAAPEPMTAGLRYVRRTRNDGFDYFIVNNSKEPAEGWQPVRGDAASAILLDPHDPSRAGLAATRHLAGFAPAEVYLQLQPGESQILRTYNRRLNGPAWPYAISAGAPIELAGTWSIFFIEGGPTLPASFTTEKLASWTLLGDSNAKRFAGTARYTLHFDAPSAPAGNSFDLDLGKVADWARITLNGQDLGSLWANPLRLSLTTSLRPKDNTLQIDVTNVAANRIIDMDNRGIQWKTFRDANVLSTGYTPYDASTWPLRDAGLLGPVRLLPTQRLNPK
jgi:alpha-L-rhamnosidase